MRGKWWAIAVLLFVLLAAIGGAAPKVVTFWKFTDTVNDPWIEARIAEYQEANPNIQISLETVPWANYLDKLLVAAASKTGPDIYYRSNDYFQTFIENGFAMNLYPKWIDDKALASYLPSVKNSIIRGTNKVYGFPIEMEPIGVYYRKDLLDKAGLQYPSDNWTWDDFATYAKKLTVTEGGTVKQFGVGLPTDPGSYTTFVFYPFLWSAGADVVDKSFKKSLLDQPAAANALKLWSDLINVDKVAPPKEIPYALANGQVAMEVSGIWMIGDYARNYPDLNYGLAPVPRGAAKQQTVYGGWFGIVNPYAKNAAAGADFFKWMLGTSERMVDWNNMKGNLTPFTQGLSNQTFVMNGTTPNDAAILKAKEFRAKVMKPGGLRAEPAYSVEMGEALSDAIQGSLFGGVDPAAAMKKAADKVDKYLSQTTIKYPPLNF